MITISNLTKSYGRQTVLYPLSVQLQAGQAVSLIGPNGAGKTTLIKSILGLVVPDSGDIWFHGQSILGGWQYRQHIGYMPQIGRYPDNMTIRQVFTMLKELRATAPQVANIPLDEELIDAFALNRHMDKPMRSLSGGTRQKVSACMAFMFNPGVLILDEPTAGLDPLATEILKDKIRREKENGKLILITSHILSDLEELTTEIMYLQDGRLQFFNSVDWLKDVTGEQKLSRAVAAVMKERKSESERRTGVKERLSDVVNYNTSA
ncbi:ABC transporter ATP-binding protein [Spirosoma gilvum]